jgi:BrnA antitoxin of type II toxin-antitoxin system
MKKEYDFRGGRRGYAVRDKTVGQTRIAIRIDRDILDWFRRRVDAAGGGSYQRLINAALRDHVAGGREALEETLRRVLQSQLGTAIEEGFRQGREYEQAFLRWRRGIRRTRKLGLGKTPAWTRDELHERHPQKKAK